MRLIRYVICIISVLRTEKTEKIIISIDYGKELCILTIKICSIYFVLKNCRSKNFKIILH